MAILLAGPATATLGKRPFLPCITLFLIFGIIIGAEDSDLIPDFFSARLELIANVTRLVPGFLLGGTLTRNTLRQSGKKILSIPSGTTVIITFTATLAFSLLGLPLEIAILLGCIASATVDTAIESGQRSSPQNRRRDYVGAGNRAAGRIKPGQPMLTEAQGIVFVCGGLALWLEVSFLIAAMGTALVATSWFPAYRQILLSVVISTTIFLNSSTGL